jgi:acyl-CoA thioester hydrolase
MTVGNPAAPLRSPLMTVEPQWTDYNGHLNMAYYNVLFDRAADHGLSSLGINLDYVQTRRLTIYTAEIHVSYLRELHQNQQVYATFHLIDFDEKRLHVFQQLHHEDGWLAATSEVLSLHIDMSGPKVTPFPKDIMANVKAMAAGHAGLPRPERVGRAIGIKRN